MIWEIERDRFGVMFSGPLEVGECKRVVEVRAVSSDLDLSWAEEVIAGELVTNSGLERWHAEKAAMGIAAALAGAGLEVREN
jgi:hypothetical protein